MSQATRRRVMATAGQAGLNTSLLNIQEVLDTLALVLCLPELCMQVMASTGWMEHVNSADRV